MAHPALSTGALMRLMEGKGSEEMPYLQLLSIKPVAGASGSAAKVKATVSDGAYISFVMFSGELLERVNSGEFPIFCVFQLTAHTCGPANAAGDRRIIIGSAAHPVAAMSERIGNPIMMKELPTSGGGGAESGALGAPVTMPVPQPMMAPPAAAALHGQGGYQQQHQYGGGSSSGAAAGAGSSGRSGPVTAAGTTGSVMPIGSLTTFTQRWTVRGRVTNKSEVKNWSNQRGTGKLFSITIVDEGNVEIRATFFQAAVDRFEPLLQVGKVYYFSNGKIKVANTQYTSVKNNLEISFDDKAQIQEAPEDSRISKAVYAFVKLDRLAAVDPNKMIDVIGAVVSVGEVANIKTKRDGSELSKKDVVIADDSGAVGGCTVNLTFWGQASSMEIAPGQILACKGVKVGDYGGRSLSSMSGTQAAVDPDIAEAHRLRGWWNTYAAQHGGSFSGLKANTERGGRGGGGGGDGDGMGGGGPLTVIEMRKPVAVLKDDITGGGRGNLAGTEGAIQICKATLFSIRRDEPGKLWYPACNGQRDRDGNMLAPGAAGGGDGDRRCNKKLTYDESGGGWRCHAGCFNPAPNYRYICSGTLIDSSGQEYATLFDAEAEAVLKHKANEVQNICVRAGADAAGLPSEAEAIFQEALGREYIFSCKSKMQEGTNGRESRVQVSVVRVREVDPVKESKALLNSLRQYAAMQQEATS